MPFLEHLEELRWRIIWSFVAVVVGAFVCFYLVQTFDVIGLLKRPIVPFLPEGKLFVTRPTDAFLINLKLAVIGGVVLGAPVIAWQTWIFLSPALYEHEKKKILPAVTAGFLLFVAGVTMAYFLILPAVLRILHGFGRDDFEFIITAAAYFSFATQVILAFGLVFQLPLFMVLVSAMGLLSPDFFRRHRRWAIVAAAVLAAFLTPPDPGSMIMMMGPLIVLYEIGIFLGAVAWRRRGRVGTAALLVLLATALVPEADAQEPRVNRDSLAAVHDSLRRAAPRGGMPGLPGVPDSLGRPAGLDTAAARQLGLPTSPSRSFPNPDSMIQALLERSGFRSTRYAADSLTLYAATRQIDLTGSALIRRETGTLEADTVRFLQDECRLHARGDPTLFDGGTVLVGEGDGGMSYNTCERRGVVQEALTNFDMTGVSWILRGGLAIDSASTRLYSAHSNLTSCDVPTPHYHFGAGKVKWVSNNIMVARPVVLYVRDVPILWLPFMFQDVRRGRRSGWLIPRFGINDLVRPSRGYRRNVSNIGYYLAFSDYFDVQFSLDWFSDNYISANGQIRYKWLDRFIDGNISVSRIWESGVDGGPGSRSLRLLWNHQQSFDQRTRLSASVDFATSARVVERNAVDPFLATATLTSALNFNKQFEWGTLALGGRRTQNLTDNLVTENFPNISLTPVPINLTPNVTWSPSFSLTNNRIFNQPAGVVTAPPLNGVPQVDSLFAATRTTSIRFNTPLRIGRWNWQNNIAISDFVTNRPSQQSFVDPDDSTQTVTRFFGSDFNTGIDWNTSFSLPMLFPSTWKLQPTLGIRNSTGGPFFLRNRNTNGRFVSQGKRLSLGASLSPALFGFFPGVGPLSRIRHAISPVLRWNYAPEATVNEAYARALDPSGRRGEIRSPALQTLTMSLSQTFEGKFRQAESDSTADPRNARKIKLLSVQTSAIAYDFEQAKEDGRNGWTTQTLSNSFTSDVLPGFSLRTTHDLWDGPVGFDSTAFDPFLSQVSARFRLTGSTIGRILALLAGTSQDEDEMEDARDALEVDSIPARLSSPLNRTAGSSLSRLPTGASPGGGFQASVTFDDQRFRPSPDGTERDPNRTLGFSVGFSPTENWGLSWTTQYNLTTAEFGQHVLRLDRDLHRWRATFSFVQAPNGNVAFNFFISLLDQPDIKFQYDQRTIGR